MNGLIHSFAHDLRSHLRTASTRSQLLQRTSPNISEKDRLFLQEIVQSISSMDSLLSAFSRYVEVCESTESPTQLVFLDLAVRGAYLKMKPMYEVKQGRINIPENISRLRVPPCTQEVLTELLTNALKFQGSTSPVVQIAIEAKDTLKISVQDNGIGVDPEYQAEIFRPFVRLHSKDAYPGNGLGLAICSELLRKTSGTLTIESESGSGSTLTCSIPFQPENHAEI